MELQLGKVYTEGELDVIESLRGMVDRTYVMFMGGDPDFNVGEVYQLVTHMTFIEFKELDSGDRLVAQSSSEWKYLGKSTTAGSIYNRDEIGTFYVVINDTDADFQVGAVVEYLGNEEFRSDSFAYTEYAFTDTIMVEIPTPDSGLEKIEKLHLNNGMIIGEEYTDRQIQQLYSTIPSSALFEFVRGDDEFVEGEHYELGKLTRLGSVRYIGKLRPFDDDQFPEGRVAWQKAVFTLVGFDDDVEPIVEDKPVTIGGLVSTNPNLDMFIEAENCLYDVIDSKLYDDNGNPVTVDSDILNKEVSSIMVYTKIEGIDAIVSLLNSTNGFVFKYVPNVGYLEYTMDTYFDGTLREITELDFYTLEDTDISEVI